MSKLHLFKERKIISPVDNDLRGFANEPWFIYSYPITVLSVPDRDPLLEHAHQQGWTSWPSKSQKNFSHICITTERAGDHKKHSVQLFVTALAAAGEGSTQLTLWQSMPLRLLMENAIKGRPEFHGIQNTIDSGQDVPFLKHDTFLQVQQPMNLYLQQAGFVSVEKRNGNFSFTVSECIAARTLEIESITAADGVERKVG